MARVCSLASHDKAADALKLFACGFSTLLCGVVAYLIDRPASITYFMPNALEAFQATPGGLHDSMPSLLHAFGFCLLSAAVLPGTRRTVALSCLGWALTSMLLELAQHERISGWLSASLPQFLAGTLPVGSYLDGVFDPLDLAFAGLGCLAAYFVVTALWLSRWPGRSH